MHNLHFISVCAKNSNEAVNVVNSEIDIGYPIVDYFNVVGAFSLNNTDDYIDLTNSSHYSLFSDLGYDSAKFKQKVIDILNSGVVPLEQLMDELRDIVINNHSYKSNLYTLACAIKQIADKVEGNTLITDLANNTKHDFKWYLTGLTNFHNDPTHIVLVDFHT